MADVLIVQARTHPHRTENGNKIHLFPRRSPQDVSTKTITEYYVGNRGVKVGFVSLPLTVFWKTQRLSRIMWVSLWIGQSKVFIHWQLHHSWERNVLTNGVESPTEDVKEITYYQLKATGNPRPFAPVRTRSGSWFATQICPITCHFKPNLAPKGRKRD